VRGSQVRRLSTLVSDNQDDGRGSRTALISAAVFMFIALVAKAIVIGGSVLDIIIGVSVVTLIYGTMIGIDLYRSR
jgi:hypothetical protein